MLFSFKFFRYLGVAFCFFLLSIPVHAKDYAGLVNGGISFETGDDTKSLNSALNYFISLGAEKAKGVIRPLTTMELEYGSGTAYVGSSKPSFTYLGGRFLLGVHFFPITIERFQPYVGGNGVVGWGYLNTSPAQSGEGPTTQSILYGYELNSGIDMRFGSKEGSALRLQASYLSTSGNLAGQSGFVISGFRLSLGMVL